MKRILFFFLDFASAPRCSIFFSPPQRYLDSNFISNRSLSFLIPIRTPTVNTSQRLLHRFLLGFCKVPRNDPTRFFLTTYFISISGSVDGVWSSRHCYDNTIIFIVRPNIVFVKSSRAPILSRLSMTGCCVSPREGHLGASRGLH